MPRTKRSVAQSALTRNANTLRRDKIQRLKLDLACIETMRQEHHAKAQALESAILVIEAELKQLMLEDKTK